MYSFPSLPLREGHDSVGVFVRRLNETLCRQSHSFKLVTHILVELTHFLCYFEEKNAASYPWCKIPLERRQFTMMPMAGKNVLSVDVQEEIS